MKCKVFHKWNVISSMRFGDDSGWIFLECKRCNNIKDYITTRYFEDMSYYNYKYAIEKVQENL